MLLENGPHNSNIINEKEPYLEIKGSFLFDTSGKTKEEIIEMDLFKGIEIFDKSENSYVLTINSYKGK